MLAQYVDIGPSNRIRIERAVGLVCRVRPSGSTHASIDDEVDDVNTLRPQLPGCALGEPAQRKLSHGEGRGEWEAFDARARPGEEDRSSSMGRHALRRLLSHVEATQRADGNSLFDRGRVDFCDRTMRPGTGVVDDNVGFAEALVDLV